MRCPCCGGRSFEFTPVLWPGLIEEWGLSQEEAAIVDREQGEHCAGCGSNFRSMALAAAITQFHRFPGTLKWFTKLRRDVSVLEVNRAGTLTPWLSAMPRHRLAEYPDVDLMAMPFADNSFDLVVHSDTLEHVADPVQGLRETHRVLKRRGATVYTVPVVPTRLSRTRDGMDPSYHAMDGERLSLVHTEYGADVWVDAHRAGFAEVRLTSLRYPQGLALTAVKR